MSAFTFFKALEKLSDLESLKKKGRIKIPDYFIKLILLNKTKLLKEQINKKILKELFLKRHLINKNFDQPKIPNFFLANQKYKSLQKISHNLDNAKSNSPLPKIDQRRSLLNMRYKDKDKDKDNNQKNNNDKNIRRFGKDNFNIKPRRTRMLSNNINNFGNNSINNINNINNSSIKTESIIPNKNIKEIYIITKRVFNGNNNITNINNSNVNNNSNNNSEPKKSNINTFYKQQNKKSNDVITTELNFEKEKEKEHLHPNLNNLRMTFITPLSRSMCSKQFVRSFGVDYFQNEICKNNSSKKFSPNLDKNNNTSKDYFPKLNINLNSESINNNRNTERIKEYNYYTLKKDEINRKYKDVENVHKMNLSSVLEKDNINNNENETDKEMNINNNLNEEDSTSQIKKKLIVNMKKPSLKDLQINMKPIRKFNFNIQPVTNTRRINKISIQNNNSSNKTNQIMLIPDFKKKHITADDFKKKLSRNMILFPLKTNIVLNNPGDKFYYFINKMYRNQFIEYMQHRTNWELITKINPEDPKTINFAWKYMSNRLNFKNYKYEPNKPSKKLKMVNLFERNYEVGNKKNMFINLINYCNQINLNVFDLVPFTIIINNTKDVDYCLEAISDIINFVNKYKEIKRNIITNKKYGEIFWFDKNFENLKNQYIYIDQNFLSKKNYWILKPTDLYQGKCIEISNSFEEISKKCRNMFKGVEKKFIPELVIREEDLSDDENNIQQNNNNSNNNNNNSVRILSTINEEKENNDNKINININGFSNNNNNMNTNINSTNNTNSNTNTNLNNLTNSSKKKAYSKMYCSNEIIIQKYLDNPLLYYKRKFDIRCFVLVDSNLNVFFCREGHLKASSEFYDLGSTNKLIHITNYSLQKKSAKFEQYEDGNEISYNDFKKFLGEKNIPLDKFDSMITQMKYLVEISFKSVGKKLLKSSPVLCFEIFGYDFIIDNDFKPWILEINNNPGLCISSPVIQKLVPRMLDDAFRITIDKVFDTKYSPDVIDEDGRYKTKYKLDGFTDEENVFEFLCNVN